MSGTIQTPLKSQECPYSFLKRLAEDMEEKVYFFASLCTILGLQKMKDYDRNHP
jgi:hypothetical protein